MQVFLRFFLPPTLAYIKKKLYLCTRINDKMANAKMVNRFTPHANGRNVKNINKFAVI